jgi:murein DD-endopeptidase MepM/ murein hydrolase activator NlpD
VSLRPSEGKAPRTLKGRLPADERRGWLSHAVVALAISALGLAVAGSMPLTTNAESTHALGADPRVGQRVTALSLPMAVPRTSPLTQTETAVVEQGALAAFAPQDRTSGAADDLVRAAVVKERAAQRAEDLSKTAEDAARLTRTAGSQLRAKNLAATDRQIRETAVKIATERRQRAIAARLAAQIARLQAEAAAVAAAASQTTPSAPAATSTPDVLSSASNSNGFSPVPGAVIGTPFGATGIWARYHTGLDFRAAEGTPIRAVQAGTVLYAGNSGDWSGNHVAIMHAGNITTMSSHMSSIAVHAGQSVRAGQVIGRVGHTGRAFGAHLHFEVYPPGVTYGDIYKAINPVGWLRAQGVRTR